MPETLVELHQRIAALERRVSSLSRTANSSGWQLGAMFEMQRFGGGERIWAFDGQSKIQYGQNDSWNQNGGLTRSNYRAATYGGPNITLDGAGEYLDNADGPWQESGSEEFLVWAWCYPTTLGADRTIAAKWDTNGVNDRSWRLWYRLASLDFGFSVSVDGNPGMGVISTYGGPIVDTWYFVAGYFEPSTTVNIYVGANTDAALTIDKVVAAVPASLFNGNAALTIGALANPADYWLGNIGKVLGRANVPTTDIDDHVNMLFLSTREFYAE